MKFSQLLESRGKRIAPGLATVQEAARIFRSAVSGNIVKKAEFAEAFTTDDYPELLSKAFEIEARAAYREIPDETTLIARQIGVPDFRRRKLRDIFGETRFERVKQTEEYKSDDPFEYTDIEHGVYKTGRQYGISWEKFLTGDFAELAQFPNVLGRGMAKTRNFELYQLMFQSNGAFLGSFWGETSSDPLGFETLKDARKWTAEQENHHGNGLVDVSSQVLVVVPSLADEANALISAGRVKETTVDNGTRREIERSNPLAGIKVQSSHTFASLVASSNRTSAWALIPGKDTDNPAILHSYLEGHRELDLRVKRDQGSRVGGGDVPFEEGSFDNDTLWYRGRYVIGADPAFTQATYASTGN